MQSPVAWNARKESPAASSVLVAHLAMGDVVLAVAAFQSESSVEQLRQNLTYFHACGVYNGVCIGDCNVKKTPETEACWKSAGWEAMPVIKNEGSGTGFCRILSSSYYH